MPYNQSEENKAEFRSVSFSRIPIGGKFFTVSEYREGQCMNEWRKGHTFKEGSNAKCLTTDRNSRFSPNEKVYIRSLKG